MPNIRKALLTCLQWLAVAAIPVLLIATNLRLAISSQQLYDYGFVKFGVSNVTGLSQTELNKVSAALVGYLSHGRDSVQVVVSQGTMQFPIFNPKELVHLADVRTLVQLDYRVQLVTLVLILAAIALGFWSGKKNGLQGLRMLMIRGGVAVFAVMAVLTAWSLIDFNQLFILFHLLGFSNNLWILDPTQDYLIMMFPEGFFYLTVLLVLGATATEALLIGGFGSWWKKRAV